MGERSVGAKKRKIKDEARKGVDEDE